MAHPFSSNLLNSCGFTLQGLFCVPICKKSSGLCCKRWSGSTKDCTPRSQWSSLFLLQLVGSQLRLRCRGNQVYEWGRSWAAYRLVTKPQRPLGIARGALPRRISSRSSLPSPSVGAARRPDAAAAAAAPVAAGPPAAVDAALRYRDQAEGLRWTSGSRFQHLAATMMPSAPPPSAHGRRCGLSCSMCDHANNDLHHPQSLYISALSSPSESCASALLWQPAFMQLIWRDELQTAYLAETLLK